MEIDLDILMILTLVGMLLAIFSGVHIALALGATAMIGTYFIFEDMYMAASQVGGAAYELIRDHIFMTIPLFVLMGDFLSRSGAAGDLYSLINKGLKGVPGRLGVATVTGNAAFAAVTGTSIASAAAFSRIVTGIVFPLKVSVTLMEASLEVRTSLTEKSCSSQRMICSVGQDSR